MLDSKASEPQFIVIIEKSMIGSESLTAITSMPFFGFSTQKYISVLKRNSFSAKSLSIQIIEDFIFKINI